MKQKPQEAAEEVGKKIKKKDNKSQSELRQQGGIHGHG